MNADPAYTDPTQILSTVFILFKSPVVKAPLGHKKIIQLAESLLSLLLFLLPHREWLWLISLHRLVSALRSVSMHSPKFSRALVCDDHSVKQGSHIKLL